MSTTLAPETAHAFSESGELVDGAENTSEGLYSVMAIRDRPADWRLDCLDRIQRLGELQANWNSYGANRVDFDSIGAAMALAKWFSQVTGIESPRVAASPAGHVALSWEWADRARELDLEVLPDGTLRYSYLDEKRPDEDREDVTADPRLIAHLLTNW